MDVLQAMKESVGLLKSTDPGLHGDVICLLSAALAEMEKAEPVAWSLWQPFGGHVQFTGDQKLATQYGLRADVMVTPLYAHPAPAIPEGWQLVPKEPTDNMCIAYTKCRTKVGENWAKHQYQEMLAAAPEYMP